VARRYYTVAEANRFVPALTAGFTTVLQLRGQMRSIYRRLEEKRFAPVGEQFEPAVPGAPPEVVRDRTTFKALVETLKAELADIEACGCQIKDLDVGLVDWLGKNGERDVFLCWRFGEPQVAYFHDLDAGFAGRRPVSELEPPRAAVH
jgi:hypothetical protein